MLGSLTLLGTLVSKIMNLFHDAPSASSTAVIFHGHAGPKYYPTQGEIWPAPFSQKKTNDYMVLVPSEFKFRVSGRTCPILRKAIERYSKVMNTEHARVKKSKTKGNFTIEDLKKNFQFKGAIKELVIKLTKGCETHPYSNMKEEYTLEISMVSFLISRTIWGILRGLESFMQSFYGNSVYKGLQINITKIHDYPRYEHRGLLLDTANHYISVQNILKTLDAMTMNKMNVLHWHLTDDSSFSFKSEILPKLSESDPVSPEKTYTAAQVKKVVSYARDRGIRVIPEFNVPGHTHSWGVVYPELLAQCYYKDKLSGIGSMDPTLQYTYNILELLLREAKELFPDTCFHLGGDGVDFECWKSNDKISKFMIDNNMYTEHSWYEYFMNRTIHILSRTVSPIVWQEAFDYMKLPSRTIIQVSKQDWDRRIAEIISHDHRVIYSSKWNLNVGPGKSYNSFDSLYLVEPRMSLSSDHKRFLIGGEALVWTDMINDASLISHTWPRASAVAEVLWSQTLKADNPELTFVPEDVKRRLEEHNCRMIRQGIQSSPAFGPDLCC